MAMGFPVTRNGAVDVCSGCVIS